jgi:outer membrane lipoprotein-sorting protein
LTKPVIAILAASLMVVLAVGAFFFAGSRQRNDARPLEEAKLKQVQDREEKIKTLEGELNQLRQDLAINRRDTGDRARSGKAPDGSASIIGPFGQNAAFANATAAPFC